MAVNPPQTVEVNTFKFIQLRKLKVLQNNESLPANVLNLVATSSRHGLVFIGLQDGFKVLKVENILDLNEDTDRQNFKLPAEQYACQKISSPPPVLLSLSADDMTLAVCVIRDSRLVADMYDIRAFADPDETPAPFIKIQLSSQSTGLKDFMWNPVVSEMYAFCLDSGDVHVHELAETTLKIIAELPPTTGATAVCWSPKGKQLVIGKKDGTLSQYKPTLQEVKKIPPPILGENNLQVLNVCWLATTQFAIVYVPATNDPDKVPSLVFVSTPKGAPVSYVDYGDVCMGGTATQTLRYTMHHQSEWNMLVCISSLSLETAVAGCINNMAWEQWILEDSGRADLPLEYNKETYPMGMGIVYCAQRKIVISDTESYPPMPLLFLLSSSGLLCPFHMLNTKPEAANLVFPSEPLSRDGERKRQGSPVAAHPTSIGLQSPPNSTPVPAVAPGQASFGMSRMENSANFNFQSASPPNISQATGKFGTPPAVLSTQTFQHVSPYAMPILAPVGPQGIPDLVPQFQGFSSTPKTIMPAEPVSLGVKTLPFIIPPTSGPSLASSFMNRPTDASSQPPTAAFVPPLSVIKSPENAAVVPKPTTMTVQKQIIEEKKEVEIKPLETENYTAAIVNEMQHFEKELQELKNSFAETPIGTKEEMAFLKKNLLMLEDFEKEMSHQMQSLNLDIHSLKTASLENFSMVGEAKSRQQRRNDPNYNMMLRDRALDPISAKKMQNIQNLHQYLIHQLQETGEKLDQDLLEFSQKRKTHAQNIKQVNSAEAIYQTIVNNQNIIHLLMMNFQTLTDLFRRQKKGPRLNYALNGKDSDVDLSRLAETLLQEKPASDTDTSNIGFSQPVRKKLSSNIQSVLRDALAHRKITCIKPTVIDHPSQSRLLSSSMINMEKKMSKLNVNTSTKITTEKDSGSITAVVGGQDAESKNIAATTSMVGPKLDLSQTPPKSMFAPAVQSAASAHYEDITPPSSPEKSIQGVTEESVSITDKPIGVTSTLNAFTFTPVNSGSKMTDGVKNTGKLTPLGGPPLSSGSTKSPFSTTSNLFLQPFQPPTFSFGSSVTAKAPDRKENVAAHNDVVVEDAVSSIANSAALFSFNQGRQVTPTTLSNPTLAQVRVIGDSVKTSSAQRLANESFSAIRANENQNAALSSMTKVATPTFGGSPAFSVTSFISPSPLASMQVLQDKTSVSNTSPGQINATLSSGIAPGTVFRVPASVFSQQSENANQTSSSVFGKSFQPAAGTTIKSSIQRPVISNTFGQAVNATMPMFGSQIATAATLPGTSAAVSSQKLQFSTPTVQQASTSASGNFGQTASPSSGTMFGQMKPASTTAKSVFTLTQPSITSALPVFSQTPINSTVSVKTPLGQSVAPLHSAGIQTAVADSVTESLSPLNLVATTADNATKSSGSFFQAASSTSNRPFIQILTTSVNTSIQTVTSTTSVSLPNETTVTSTSPTSPFNQTTVTTASVINPSGRATIATTSATSLFSQSAVTTASSFGQSADSTTDPTNPLGQAKDSTTTPTSPFGQPAVSATSPTSPFGQPAVSATTPTSPFGQPAVSATSPTSPFGQPAVSATTPTSPFGQPAVSATSPTSPFGQPAVSATSPTNPFGQSAVSATSPTSPFGQSAVSATSPTSPFGQSAVSATSPTSPFGQSADSSTSPASPFSPAAVSSTSPASPFGQIPAATSAATSPFNQVTTTTTITSPILFGQTVTTSTAPTPLFGQTSLPVITSQFDNRPSGIFGQTPSASSSFTQNVNSSFGQTTVSPNASPFGQTGFLGAATPGSLFGQNDQTNSSSIFGGQSAALGFSFGKASSFGQSPSPAGSFGLAKAVLGQTPNSPSSSFGQPADPTTFGQGSFMGGLGGKPSEQNASKNIFSSPIGNSPSGGNGLFGSQGASTFGSKPASSFTGGSFSAVSGSVAQSGFGAFQQTQKPAGFGAPASFGGSPTFGGGSPPSFGATPTFGSAQPASPFGTTQSSFSAFANADAPTFGSLASQTGAFQSVPAQQPQGNVFGGGSVFGGAAAAPSFGSPTQQSRFGSPSGGGGSSAFNQWRS